MLRRIYSCTIDKVLLLHSVVLPKMVVRSVHKERKWKTSRGNEQMLYCSYLILKRFLNLVPAFCAKGHKSHKLWSLQCSCIWQKILLRRTRDAGLHWKRWTYSECTLQLLIDINFTPAIGLYCVASLTISRTWKAKKYRCIEQILKWWKSTLDITITKFSNLIGYQRSWFQ